jgi:hypothetical protein
MVTFSFDEMPVHRAFVKFTAVHCVSKSDYLLLMAMENTETNNSKKKKKKKKKKKFKRYCL